MVLESKYTEARRMSEDGHDHKRSDFDTDQEAFSLYFDGVSRCWSINVLCIQYCLYSNGRVAMARPCTTNVDAATKRFRITPGTFILPNVTFEQKMMVYGIVLIFLK